MFEIIQNSFNGMFGKVAPGMCRLTMNGNVAVKCSNGYKTYNVKKGTLTNVTNFCFNIGDEMFFIMGWCLTDTCNRILKTVINHTRNIQSKDFERLPYPAWVKPQARLDAISLVKAMIARAQTSPRPPAFRRELARLERLFRLPR